MRPCIGLTTYGQNAQGEYRLFADYVEAVRRAGATTVLLPPGEPHVSDWLDRIDGVVIAGGGDLDPSCYGGAAHPTLAEIDVARDRSDLDLLRALLVRRRPLLAICRGMQWVNVALGGTLHVHLPERARAEGEPVVDHRTETGAPLPHEVVIDERSRLASVMGVTRSSPLSWHHQAVDRLGAGVRVVARAPDGVVEAIEVDGYPGLIAVQWHPELTAVVEAEQQRLFDSLVASARAGYGPQLGDPLASVGF